MGVRPRWLLLGSLCAVAGISAPATAGTDRAPLDVRLEFGNDFRLVLYSDPPALVRGVAPDGANGVNAEWERGTGPGLYIEEQRHGEEAIIAGVEHHDARVWRLGLRELAWGFAQQGPGGNFPATEDAFHSTSFFVEAVDPELGGRDSSYQARGLVYAEHYLAWLPRDPSAAHLRGAIRRGLAWERTRVPAPTPPSRRASAHGVSPTRRRWARDFYRCRHHLPLCRSWKTTSLRPRAVTTSQ
jgi:hypothetical protein